MGTIKRPDKVKLTVGLLSGDTALFQKVKKELEGIYGVVDLESGILDFGHTDYYRQEMGERLKRIFYSFKRPVTLSDIYKVKLRTNLIEKRFLINGKRAVNIDPGYLNLSKLVVFSTKDYTHRIYLNEGIYAEVTLFYKDGIYNPWPWTYPDYKTEAYIKFFNSVRAIYKESNS
ncbi:MAG: DUF4416 family protein [Candidatus Omnitrophica bacterium]|nr:DUF4416 family protein [Candidatus Omnitrophota bacterium]